MKMGKRGIVLDPNNWYDAEWWYEDEPEVFNFMQKNEDIIKEYAKEKGMTIKNTIDYLFKNKV
jgi:hypothetical protein